MKGHRRRIHELDSNSTCTQRSGTDGAILSLKGEEKEELAGRKRWWVFFCVCRLCEGGTNGEEGEKERDGKAAA